MNTLQRFQCRYYNSKKPQCFQHPKIQPEKDDHDTCPLIKHKMLTYIVCDDGGSIDLDWTKVIIYHNVLNEYFIKL